MAVRGDVETLYRQRAPAVYKYLLCLTHDQALAEDLTADTFERALSGFEPECMFEFFPAAAAGSVAEGAKLTTRVIPAAIECPDCGYSGEAKGAECPQCGGWSFRLTQGREFYIDSIVVE